MPKKFEPGFKEAVIGQLGKKPDREIARKFNLSPATVYRWRVDAGISAYMEGTYRDVPEEVEKRSPGADVAEKKAPVRMRMQAGRGEEPYQHLAFLVYCAQDKPNQSAIGRIVNRTISSVRQWMKTYEWDSRSDFADAQHWGVYLIHKCYPDMVEAVVKELKDHEALNEIYESLGINDAAVQQHPETPDPEDIAKSEQMLQEATQMKENRNKDLQVLNGIVRISHSDLAKRIQKGETHARVQDLPALVKTYMLLNGNPTEIVGHVAAGESRVVESVRVQSVKESGGSETDVLKAMKEDLKEMTVVVDALLCSQEERDNVITLRPNEAKNGG